MSVQYSQEIEIAAANPKLMRGRRRVLSKVAASLNEASTALYAFGVIYGTDRRDQVSPFGNGSDEAVGVATLLMVASRLVRGILRSLSEKDIYCAGALARQLVEVEYLLWAIANKKRDAAVWLRSDRKNRQKDSQPRHIREDSNGVLSNTDYQHHCEFGGHPTPQVRHVLFHHDPTAIEILLADIRQHMRRILAFFLEWLDDYTLSEAPQFLEIKPLLSRLETQMAEDRLASALGNFLRAIQE